MTTLEDEISADIGERKNLLLTTKTLPFRYSFSEEDRQFFINYSVLIIYAIWEGFVQQSFQAYVRALNKLNLKREQICDKILIFTLENNFKQLKEYPIKTDSQKIHYFKGLNSFFQKELIEIPSVINTESNVGFAVINKLLENFNLEELPEYLKPRYSLKNELSFFIDKNRNPIAHGNAGGIIVSQTDIERFMKLVELLMDEVFNKISIGYKDKTFLKSKYQTSDA